MVAHQPVTLAPGERPLFGFFRDFAAFIGPRGWSAGGLLLAGALVEGLGLLLLLPLLGLVLGGGTGQAWLDDLAGEATLSPGDGRTAQLAGLLAFFALLMLLRGAIILARDVQLARLHIGFVEQQRMRIVRLLAGSSWHALARLQHGRITHVLGADIQACGDAANLSLVCCVAAAMLTGQMLLVLLLSPALAVLVVGLLGVGALLLRPALRRSRELGAELTETNLALVSGTNQFLGGLKLALGQNLAGSFVREFADMLGLAGRRRIAFQRQRTLTQVALTTLAALVGGVTLLVGIGLVDAAPATLIAFLFILARMNGPVGQIQNAAHHVVHALPAYRQVKALQAELATVQEPRSEAAAGARPSGPVELIDVSYEHVAGPSPAGVRGVSLRIEPGRFVGLVGPSGAGKTTLVDLLIGLYPPQRGQVLVGGQALQGAALAGWRDAIGYVAQDPFLFHDTILRNLLWARPEASEADLWAALDLAGAGPLVRRLGLDAMVGERGGLVSGGERQRLALARALLRQPSFMVLDEATNAIDQTGEAELLARLAALPARPTIVMIAHRASSLACCDQLVELRDGRLAGEAGR